VYLREAAPLVAVIKRLMVESYELLNPEVALPDPDGVTVYLSNHGPLLTPFPAAALTVDHLLRRGGYDELVAVTLFHRVVEWVPGLSPVLSRYFGHSTPELRSVAGLTALMRQRRIQILGTAPEGRSCVWAYDQGVGPFTKVGLMVAALQAGADIVLAAQKGLERFGLPLRLPGGAALPLPDRPRGVQLPRWVPGYRTHVTVHYGRYQPLLDPAARAALDPAARRAQLDQELGAIHHQLGALYAEIP